MPLFLVRHATAGKRSKWLEDPANDNDDRKRPLDDKGILQAAALADRLARHEQQGALRNLDDKLAQLGSYGGGNHFGECEVVRVGSDDRARRVAPFPEHPADDGRGELRHRRERN